MKDWPTDLSPLGDVRLLHVDQDLLVVDKPAGLLSVPGRGEDKADSVSARLLQLDPNVRVVHRLDRDTSGLLVFARNADAHRTLNRSFEARLVDKRYQAWADGLLHIDGTWHDIRLPIWLDWEQRPRRSIDHDRGQSAHTRRQALEQDAQAARTRVLLEPVTGRTHQLRVHMMAVGHPLWGDTLYAPPELAAKSTRLCLHACWLRLPHPRDGEAREWQSACPF